MIIVDSKEASKNPKIVEALMKENIRVEKRPLKVGDYFIIGKKKNIILERKTCWDFIHSVSSRRMIDQILMLVNVENAEPRILIEGSLGLISKFSRWSPQGVIGSLLSIQEDWRIPVFFVPSKRWTPIFIAKLHGNLGKLKEEKIYPLRVKPKVETLDEQIRCVIEGIPGISSVLAHELLLHFKSIEKLTSASIDDLMKVPKIGKKKATKIWEVLHSEYEPSWKSRNTRST